MVPRDPTAHPEFEAEKWTEVNLSTPDRTDVQLVPPSVVFTTKPLPDEPPPAAQPVFWSMKKTEFNGAAVVS